MAHRTADRFAPGTSHRPGHRKNEPTGDDDSCITHDSQHLGQRTTWLAGGKHPDRAFKGSPTRANSAAAPAVRNAHRLVGGIISILVEPTGYNASVGSCAARKD